MLRRGFRYSNIAVFGGGVSTLFYDTFTGTDSTTLASHTPDIGSAWTAIEGNLVIKSNRAVSAIVNANYSNRTNIGVADVTITADVLFELLTNNDFLQFLGRGTAINNMWLAFMGTAVGTKLLDITEANGGVFTTRASTTPTLSTSTTYPVTVTFYGQTITASINGSSVSYGSASFQETNTNFGIRLISTGSLVTGVDNYKVTT